jgi:hypothetical protein
MKMKRAINLYLDEEVIEIGRKTAEYHHRSLSEFVGGFLIHAGKIMIKDIEEQKKFNNAVTTDDKEKK